MKPSPQNPVHFLLCAVFFLQLPHAFALSVPDAFTSSGEAHSGAYLDMSFPPEVLLELKKHPTTAHPYFINVATPPSGFLPVLPGTDAQETTDRINALLKAFNGETVGLILDSNGDVIGNLNGSGFCTHTIYFPAGTYYIAGTLVPQIAPGNLAPGVRLRGAGRGLTIFKLAQNTFTNANSPQPVLRLGFQDTRENTAFANFIEHLTVQIDAGNPGAVAIEGNIANCGSIAYVNVENISSTVAAMGFDFRSGPAFVKNVRVSGPFKQAIHCNQVPSNTVTFENVLLSGFTVAGIYDEAKIITVRNLETYDTLGKPGIFLEEASSMVVLQNAELIGVSGAAIQVNGADAANAGFIFARDAVSPGYSESVSAPFALPSFPTGFWQSRTLIPTQVDENYAAVSGSRYSLSAPITPLESKEFFSGNGNDWQSVTTVSQNPATPRDFGPRPETTNNDTIGIQKAIDTGKPVIYLPPGTYDIKTDIIVKTTVKKIEGLFACLYSNNGSQIIVEGSDNADVILQDLRPEYASDSIPIVFNAAGENATLTLRNKLQRGDVNCGSSLQPSAKLFLECGGPKLSVDVNRGISVFSRGVDRGTDNFTVTGGSTLWILGDNIESNEGGSPNLKPCTIAGGSRVEIWGGDLDCLFKVHNYSPPRSLFAISGANTRFSAVVGCHNRMVTGSDPPVWGSWGQWIEDFSAPAAAAPGGDGKVLIVHEELPYVQRNTAERRVILPFYSWQTSAPSLAIERRGNNADLRFRSSIGQSYQIEYKADLGTGIWRSLGGPLLGTGADLVGTDASTFGRPKRFYRMQIGE